MAKAVRAEVVTRLCLAVALWAVVASVVACGGNDEAAIRSAFEKLQAGFQTRDAAALCAVTTSAAQRHVGFAGHQRPETCERDMNGLLARVLSSPLVRPRPTIGRIEVDGDHASALISYGAGPPTRIPFAKDDGDWKADAMYGGVSATAQRDKFLGAE